MISSRESFAAFVESAWRSLGLEGANALSAPVNMDGLYDWAANYNPRALAPKQTLAGTALDRALGAYVAATVPHKIVLQTTPDWIALTDDVDLLLQYYRERARGERPAPIAAGGELAEACLHVYPRGPADANWRLGVNVEPRDMARAMERFTPLLDQHAAIDHI